jgi:hypothetical protein
LIQEIKRYNNLLKYISNSLEEILSIIENFEIKTDEDEQFCLCLLLGKIPAKWKKYSISSNKTLVK